MKKIFSILSIVITLGALVAPALVLAHGSPQFNIMKEDLKTLAVANKTTGTGWQDNSVTANVNDQLVFRVYYHNAVVDSVAHNTRVRLSYPTSFQNTITVAASLSADNAPAKTDSVVINSSPAQKIVIDTSSVKWYPNQSLNPTSVSATSYGANFIELNIGDIQGCWPYQGYVTFTGTLTPEVVTLPDMSIVKLVRNQTAGQTGFADSTNANSKDLLNFQIQITNTGKIALTNVMVRDTLPTILTYVAGSTQVNGVFVANGITDGGINIGSLAQGAVHTITFNAIVNSYSSSQTVINYAYALADQMKENRDEATVYLTTLAPIYALTINKTVRNLTAGQTGYVESTNANNYDKLAFQIQIQNTGNTTLNNVIVRDTLPVYLSFVSGSARLDGVYLSDSLISGEINIGSISTGSIKTITFEVTANSSASASQTLINYAYARADQVSEKNDTATVNLSQSYNPGNLNISKLVRNVTTGTTLSSSANAKVGDRVMFLIQVTTPVNISPVNNVRVWDNLPAGLSYVPGSTRVDNAYVSDGLVSGGINLGTMSANQSKSINFEATVNSSGNNQTMTNYAYTVGDGVAQQSAFAQVITGAPVIMPVPVQAVTGGNDLARNIAISIMISLWGIFLIYLYGEYLYNNWGNLKLKFLTWKIRLREGIK